MSNILIQSRYYKVLPFIKSLKLSIKLKNFGGLIFFVGSWGLSLLYFEKLFFIYKFKIFFNCSGTQNYGVTFFSLLKNLYCGLQILHKTLILVKGLGFKVSSLHNLLILKLGFSHLIIIKVPKFICVKILNKFTNINLASTNLELLNSFCAKFRYLKRPNAYKGKGIRYINEYVRLKVVKKL